MFPDVDDDIKDIFIEEAGEVLEDIIPKFATWQQTGASDLLIDVRRGFHTLKGSGRMVGAMELGELAWAIENMMNRVLDNSVIFDDGMRHLVSDVLSGFGDLVALFAQNIKEYPPQMTLWTAAAHAYSKGLGSEFDYRTLQNAPTKDTDQDKSVEPPEVSQAPQRIAEVPTLQKSQDDDVEIDGMQAQQSVQQSRMSDALNSIQQVGEIMQNAPVLTAHDEEEEMLCHIFIEEGRELLEQVKEFLLDNEYSQSVPVNDEIVRAFHTLRGASGLPPLADVGDVGATIERVLQDLQQHELPMGQTHLQALDNAVALIEARLSAYENPTPADQGWHFDEDKQVLETLLLNPEHEEYPSVGELIVGLDDLIDADLTLEDAFAKDVGSILAYSQKQLGLIDILSERTLSRLAFGRVLSALRSAYRLVDEYPDCASDKNFVQALVDSHQELLGLFDSLAGSMSLHIDEATIARLDDSVVKHTVDYHRQKHLDNIAHYQNAVVTVFNKQLISEQLQIENIKTDDELLQIFLDEALTLSDVAEETYKAWCNDLNNEEHLQTMKRYAHTVKGGARLAGVYSISELSAELETVFKRLQMGQIKLSKGWLSIIDKVNHVLLMQFEMIQNTKQSFFADRTIRELQDHLVVGQVADNASVFVPEIEFDGEEEEVFTKETTVESTAPRLSRQQLITASWQGSTPDSDILAVFLEEAKELAESSSQEFDTFRNDTANKEVLHSLQRKLHTIKGGARMVSANGMADLAHEMETLYEYLGDGRRQANEKVTQLLFACHDWITSAIGLLEQEYNPPRPTPLIDALNHYVQNADSLTVVPSVSLEKDIETLALAEDVDAQDESQADGKDILSMPPMKGVFGEHSEQVNTGGEMIRISASLMEEMINLSGEAEINRARIDMNMVSLTSSIEEMGATAQRLSDQLRRMDIELEAQILAQLDTDTLTADFDPLEMDQYSSLNQLSKSLSESASDLVDIKATLLEKTRDSENLLLQLSRTQSQLQDNLMSSRMVPFSRLTPRLQRIVRQTAGELGKTVELTVINADDEMDRNILDRITSPLEHMLRNAVDHGIEFPDKRSEMGKTAAGHIILEVQREGNEISIILSDDGAGVNVEAVRKKALSQGLIREEDELSDNDIMQYIFNSGLSTTNKITQISGRGVGMDVVRTEIRQLGGSVAVESERGKGSRFIIRVPLTVAMSDALVVRVADRQYAVPLIQIERVVQVDTRALLNYYQLGVGQLRIDNKGYRLRYLDEILNNNHFMEAPAENSLPVIIIKNSVGQLVAIQVDEIVGSRTEVVVKPLGRQLSHLSGISAATIMGDGSVMLILDLLALMRTPQQARPNMRQAVKASQRDVIMVVDDSVTVRKVTSRFLERHGFEVVVAKDGVDAVEKLQDTIPDLILLDIEMPRMDGFEVATQIRNSPRLKDLPIIMITSRTGEKHRQHALDIGVNDYMGKPFQEADLLARIYTILDLSE